MLVMVVEAVPLMVGWVISPDIVEEEKSLEERGVIDRELRKRGCVNTEDGIEDDKQRRWMRCMEDQGNNFS